MVSDAEGDFQMAIRHIEHALALDPLEAIRPFEIISSRIRGAFVGADVDWA